MRPIVVYDVHRTVTLICGWLPERYMTGEITLVYDSVFMFREKGKKRSEPHATGSWSILEE